MARIGNATKCPTGKHSKTVEYKIPKMKNFSQTGKALEPHSTYSDFWDKPCTLGKKPKREERIEFHDEGKQVSLKGDSRPKHNAGVVNNNTSTVKRTRTKKGKIKIKVSAAASKRGADFFKMLPGETLFARVDPMYDRREERGGYKNRIETYKRSFERREEKPEEYEKRLYISPTEKKPKYSKEPPFRRKKLYGRWSKNPKYGRMELVVTTEPEEEWTIEKIIPLIEKE